MSLVLDPSWWLSYTGPIAPWWLACALLGLLALPLTLRVFDALADAGAGLSLGTGVMLTTWIAWVLTYVGVPHGRSSIAAAAALVGVASAAAWWRAPRRLLEALRATLVPFLVAQMLFAVGFVYFCNVRSYMPAATFEAGLSGAEKLGNLMHLNGVLRATTMPPGDAWLLGEPSNYYYGGHLLVGTLAKLTGTPARYAFNYGLATTFALTLAMGFSLTYSMVVRRGPRPIRGLAWPRGLAWGLVGALAIAWFGNLDAWRQLGLRDPFEVVREAEERLSRERVSAPAPRRAEIDREQAGLEREMERSPARARWSLRNLEQVDYWASSRAIRGGAAPGTDPGTITEFPYFSALLGDLHPHHLALPYTIAALAASLALLRRNARQAARDDREWWARCRVPLLAMGATIGAVFIVNIWDAIVLASLSLLAIAASRRGVAADARWHALIFPTSTGALLWLGALVLNIWGRAPALGTPALAMAGLGVATLGPLLVRRYAPARALTEGRRLSIHAGAAIAAVGGLLAARATPDVALFDALVAAARDALLFEAAAFTAARAQARVRPWLTNVIGGLGMSASLGAVALLVAGPFLWSFRSPLGASWPLLQSALPPRLSTFILSDEGPPLVHRLWMASPINPFPADLRSELGDYLAHWGLFVLPLVAFVLYWLARVGGRDRAFALGLLGLAALTIGVTAVAMQGYWTAPIALALALTCAALLRAPRAGIDAPVLVFAVTGFFWSWFVEALHFDDSYGGSLERYNTPFKIFYPLWPALAAAALGALRRMAPRLPRRAPPLLALLASPGVLAMVAVVLAVASCTLDLEEGLVAAGVAVAGALGVGLLVQLAARFASSRVSSEAPAVVAGLLFGGLGLLYPFAATAVRTRGFFTQPIEGTWMTDRTNERVREFYTQRSLDALAWIGQTPRLADDLPAITWLNDHGRAGAIVLEAPSGGAYTPEGRVSSATGLPTLVGWTHHENQWRGWRRPMPESLQRRFFDELTERLPVLELGIPLSRDAQIELYRASLESPDALRAHLRAALPEVEDRALREQARAIVAARQGAFTAMVLTHRLHEHMSALWSARDLDAETWRLLRLYRVRYVFAGCLERETFGAALDKFAALPKAFASGRTVVYEVPDSGAPAAENIPAR